MPCDHWPAAPSPGSSLRVCCARPWKHAWHRSGRHLSGSKPSHVQDSHASVIVRAILTVRPTAMHHMPIATRTHHLLQTIKPPRDKNGPGRDGHVALESGENRVVGAHDGCRQALGPFMPPNSSLDLPSRPRQCTLASLYSLPLASLFHSLAPSLTPTFPLRHIPTLSAHAPSFLSFSLL